MKRYKLDKFDIEDLEYSLFEFEKKYGIFFTQDELNTISNFEQLINKIVEKFNYKNYDDCTTQQAFYKLKIIFDNLKISNQNIEPKTELKKIIPRKNRIKTVKLIEKELGFKLKILEPQKFWIGLLIITSICSIISGFYNITYLFISGIILFYIYRIIFENGKEFKIENVGELAKLVTKENYFQARRNGKTINKSEFREMVLNWFTERMGIEKEKLLTATLN